MKKQRDLLDKAYIHTKGGIEPAQYDYEKGAVNHQLRAEIITIFLQLQYIIYLPLKSADC